MLYRAKKRGDQGRTSRRTPESRRTTERRTPALLRKGSRLRARDRGAAVVETVETVGEGRGDALSVCAKLTLNLIGCCGAERGEGADRVGRLRAVEKRAV